MITNKQIWDDEEWIGRLENIHKLRSIFSKYYWYDNYVNWITGSIFDDIRKRRRENQSTNPYIKKLEDFLFRIE